MVNQVISNEITEKFDSSRGFLMQEILHLQEEIEKRNECIRRLDLKIVQLRLGKMVYEAEEKKKFNDTNSSSSGNPINKKSLAEEKEVIDSINENYSSLNKLIQRKSNFDNLLQCVELVQNDLHKTNIDNITYGDYGIKILETQESERKRIARDLHDTTVQNITNLMHKTELCFRLIDMDPVRAKLELQTMIKTIKNTIKDMRGIIYDLRPMLLDDLGFVPTVERYIREVNNANDNLVVKIEIKNKEVRALSVINLTLFRVVQETISNAIKHGKATRIQVIVDYIGHDVKLLIKDNGVGFSSKKDLSEHKDIFSGYGLSMMRERINLLSGEIEFITGTNEGTEVIVTVPLRTYKEDI